MIKHLEGLSGSMLAIGFTVFLAAWALFKYQEATHVGWMTFYFISTLLGIYLAAVYLQAAIQREIRKHTRGEDQ